MQTYIYILWRVPSRDCKDVPLCLKLPEGYGDWRWLEMSRIQCRHHRTAKQEYVVVYTPVLMKLIYHLCIGGDLLLVSSSLELQRK